MSTSTPRTTATATFLPSATPAADDSATRPTLLDHTRYTDERGHEHVVGQVRNDTRHNLHLVRLDGFFYDQGHAPVAEATAYAYIDVLRPGEAAPFRLSLSETPPRPIVSYSLRASATPTEDEPFLGIQFAGHDAQLDLAGSEDERDALTLIGQVTNVETWPASDVHIACALYDEQGHVVNVALAYAEVDVLEPGARAPFKLWFPEINGRPANYHILAYAQRAEPYQIERQAQIEVVSTRVYQGEIGQWVLIGEVQNVDQVPARFVQIAASVFDEKDTLIAVDSTFAWRSTLAPEHRSAFEITLYGPPKGIDHWQLDVRGTRAQEVAPTDLVLQEVQNEVGADNRALFTGLVRNNTAATVTKVEVGVTIYGPDAEIAAAERTWIDVTLRPGDTTPFELDVYAPPGADSYVLYAEGRLEN